MNKDYKEQGELNPDFPESEEDYDSIKQNNIILYGFEWEEIDLESYWATSWYLRMIIITNNEVSKYYKKIDSLDNEKWELKVCWNCSQMTNHKGNKCLKCNSMDIKDRIDSLSEKAEPPRVGYSDMEDKVVLGTKQNGSHDLNPALKNDNRSQTVIGNSGGDTDKSPDSNSEGESISGFKTPSTKPAPSETSKCSYCDKECSMQAFVPETHSTIDFPFCNDKCLKKFRLLRGYDVAETIWEIDFKISLLQQDRREFINRINEEIEFLEDKKKEVKI